MSTLDGAFGNLHNFLHFIALNNCVDLFHEEQVEEEQIAERGKPADSTRRKYSRLLFNAVVSLDSVLDHAFSAEGGGKQNEQWAFNEKLFKKEPALRDLREVSNALKHCVTRSSKKVDGVDLVQNQLEGAVRINEDGSFEVNTVIQSEVLAMAREALPQAFRFWRAQGQQMDARNPRINLSNENPKPDHRSSTS